MSSSPQITQCNELKDPTGSEKTTILTLSQNNDLNGKFFQKKTQHWSWWVFPSFTKNKKYTQFHLDDNAQIYKSIANNQQYLNAYTKVLGYITEEIKQTPFYVGYHIDFPKAMYCYYRIYLQTQHSPTVMEFNKQFLEFSKAITNNKNEILSGLQAKSPQFYTNNEKKVNQICNFNTLKQPTSPIINPPINPIPNNPPIKKTSPNTTQSATPNKHINPIQPQPTQNNTKTNNINNITKQQPQQQTPLQYLYNPILYYPQTIYPKTTYYYKQHQPTQTHPNHTTTTTTNNPVKWYDVLLCILLPVIWWIVVAQKINNQKPTQNLTTTYTTNNKTL